MFDLLAIVDCKEKAPSWKLRGLVTFSVARELLDSTGALAGGALSASLRSGATTL